MIIPGNTSPRCRLTWSLAFSHLGIILPLQWCEKFDLPSRCFLLGCPGPQRGISAERLLLYTDSSGTRCRLYP
ncbi:hypothetical protein AMECASPLE_036426 [Ameca splendens]|uniref:Uncharacterized protein n=1 Tax=Ameca splendens TaxID=208324 RepID=A0ABV1AE00_9TELE